MRRTKHDMMRSLRGRNRLHMKITGDFYSIVAQFFVHPYATLVPRPALLWHTLVGCAGRAIVARLRWWVLVRIVDKP